MIYTEIEKLMKDITQGCKVTVHFGDKDAGPDDYPLIQLIPDQSFTLSTITGAAFLDFPVTIKIINGRTEEIETLKVLDNLLCTLLDKYECQGHTFGEGGTPTYTDNTYEITIPFVLKQTTLEKA